MDAAGLARAQDIMVSGGTLPADKKVAYDKIVTTDYADKAPAEVRREVRSGHASPAGEVRRPSSPFAT